MDWMAFLPFLLGAANLGFNIYGSQGGGGSSQTPMPQQAPPQMAPFEPPDMSAWFLGMQQMMADQAAQQQKMFAQQQAEFDDMQMKNMARDALSTSRNLASRGITSGAAFHDPAALAQNMGVNDMDMFKSAMKKYGNEFGLDFGDYGTGWT